MAEARAAGLAVSGSNEDLRDRGLAREYAVKDAMIAASFLMIAAEAAGLATSPMNGRDEEAVKKAIGIDGREDLHIALLMPLGHPAETRAHPGRRLVRISLLTALAPPSGAPPTWSPPSSCRPTGPCSPPPCAPCPPG